MLLLRWYAVDKPSGDVLLAWLKPYEVLVSRLGESAGNKKRQWLTVYKC
jgi:hypothetical protein